MKRIALLLFIVLSGCSRPVVVVDRLKDDKPKATPAQKSKEFQSPPRIERLELDWPEDAMAIWGSLGRDGRGNIHVGLSVASKRSASAMLMTYSPSDRQWTNQGHVIDFIAHPIGVSQNKIHTRIHELPSGELLFASMDESGELNDGSLLPTYGSYIWMVNAKKEWTLVKKVPEGIIASAAGGDSVWFLGYFDHVVYRYDLKTRGITQTRVGATGGHVSRNFVVDDRGHAFIPRLRGSQASLVELNPNLEEISVTPMTDYGLVPDDSSHGIISWVRLDDGTLAIVTDGGRLYTIKDGHVTDRKRFYPAGPAYLSCLVSPDGQNKLVAIANQRFGHDWIEYDLTTDRHRVQPITIPVPDGATNILVYGSGVRDLDGRWYLGGAFAAKGEKNLTPAIWRIE